MPTSHLESRKTIELWVAIWLGSTTLRQVTNAALWLQSWTARLFAGYMCREGESGPRRCEIERDSGMGQPVCVSRMEIRPYCFGQLRINAMIYICRFTGAQSMYRPREKAAKSVEILGCGPVVVSFLGAGRCRCVGFGATDRIKIIARSGIWG